MHLTLFVGLWKNIKEEGMQFTARFFGSVQLEKMPKLVLVPHQGSSSYVPSVIINQNERTLSPRITHPVWARTLFVQCF